MAIWVMAVVGVAPCQCFSLRRAPDHVTRSYFHFWTAFALHPPTPGRDDQGLPERVGVPCRAGAGLERDTRATRACRIGCLEQGIDTHSAGEIFRRSFAEGCEPLLLMSISRTPLFTPLVKLVACLLTAMRKCNSCGGM